MNLIDQLLIAAMGNPAWMQNTIKRYGSNTDPGSVSDLCLARAIGNLQDRLHAELGPQEESRDDD